MQFQLVKFAGEDLGPLGREWTELLARTAAYSFCQTPAYCQVAMHQALERGATVNVLLAYDGAALMGIWPLITTQEHGLSVTRPASCGLNEEYSEPPVDSRKGLETLRCLLAGAVALPTDMLFVYNVAHDSKFAEIMREPQFSRLQSISGQIDGYSLKLSKYPTWEDYLANSSGSHRKDLRRDLRRLERMGAFRMGQCETPQDVESVLRAAFEEKRRWAVAKREHVKWLENDDVLQFFTRLAETIDLKINPLVTYIKVNEQPVAAQINFVGNKVFEALFTMFDPAYSKGSPGQVLFEHGIETAHRLGLDCDFRILAAPYKVKLCDTVTHYTTYQILLSRKAKLLRPLMESAEHFLARSRRIASRARPALREIRSRLGNLRRHARYLRHKAGDRALGIKTLDRPISDLGAFVTRGWYEPLSYAALKTIEQRIPLNSEDVLFDIGAGMGGVVCYFAQRPLREIVGIEVDQQLADRALENTRKMRGRKAQSVRIICADAQMQGYRDPSVILMYNPFDDSIMRPVLRKIVQGLRENPRKLRIVYANPVQEKVFAEFPQLGITERFFVPYQSGKMEVIVYTACG